MRCPLLAKSLALGLILLLLSAALMRIGGLVDERRERHQEAVRSVEQSHAGAQQLVGPWIERRCTEEWDTVVGEGKDRKTVVEQRDIRLAAVADRIEGSGQLRSELRQRGLYRVHSYAGGFELTAQWLALPSLEPRAERAGSRLACEPARLVLALGDVRGVRAARLLLDGQPHALRPGSQTAAFGAGLHADLDAPRAGQPLQARLTLELVGTGELALVPSAEANDWRLSSDWPHPSFGGRFLPTTHSIGTQGFEARWQVSSLATEAPALLARGGSGCGRADRSAAVPVAQRGPCPDTMAISFFDPVNPYVLSDRAIKYGLLFIVLTFVAVALVEVLSRRRVHPVQYALVGLALATFFLLLLSLSEHLAFAQAYAAAAAGCSLLLGHYAAHLLGSRAGGLAFGAAVAGLYGLLYLLLQMEQNALVVGALGLFAALTAVMVLTRRLDWYALFDGWRRAAPAGLPAAAATVSAPGAVRPSAE